MNQDKVFDKPITLQKGDCFGEFNLGSTIVIVFEAPKDFEFTLEQNTRVKVGQGMLDPIENRIRNAKIREVLL